MYREIMWISHVMYIRSTPDGNWYRASAKEAVKELQEEIASLRQIIAEQNADLATAYLTRYKEEKV